MFWVFSLLVVAAWGGACVESSLTGKVDGGLTGSKGLTCEKASDCWDGLACTDGICGGKPAEAVAEVTAEKAAEKTVTPEEAAPAEKAPADGSAESGTPETTAEPVAEAGQCKGNVDAQGFCAQDSDCCAGQTCGSFPFGAQTLRLCTTCTTNDDCPQTTQCCSFGTVSVCALQCSAPTP